MGKKIIRRHERLTNPTEMIKDNFLPNLLFMISAVRFAKISANAAIVKFL